MKKITFSLLLLIFSNYLSAKDKNLIPFEKLDTLRLILQYDFYFQVDSTDINSVRYDNMVLLVGNKISYFYSYNKLLVDSSLKKFNTMEQFREFLLNPELQPPKPTVLYHIYKNYPDNMITYFEMIAPDTYLYRETLSLMEWDIKEDQLKWQKYTLQKATTTFGGRTWEAWFAPGIPISDGPYKFHGLPGLILKIKDSKEHYVFVLDIIEAAEEGAVIEFANGIRYINTDKKGYYQAYEYFRNDIINRAKEVGIDAPDLLQNMARTMQKRNNPIELIAD